MRKIGRYKYVVFGAVMAAGCAAGQASAADKYVVGVSNTLIGNGWREEMVCSIKAEALASGKVSKVILANRNGGPSEQIADLRNLISAGANIIIINPSDRKALDPVIKQATDKKIVVVAVDQAVSAPTAYVVTNDQTAYGEWGPRRCSRSWAARAMSWSCAASTACPPTPTATRASRRRSRNIPTSRSSHRSSPAGRRTRLRRR